MILTYKPSTPGAKMVRRRQARRVAESTYEIISRDGKRRYRVFVFPTGDTHCNCTAGTRDRVCWHGVRALQRHLGGAVD